MIWSTLFWLSLALASVVGVVVAAKRLWAWGKREYVRMWWR
jgi:hypothetical protein